MISIKYISSAKSPSGYGSAARQDIASLFVAGISVRCETISQTVEMSDYGLSGAVCKNLEGRNIPYKISLFHLTPDLIPTYKEKGVYMISRLAWETDVLPKEWIAPLNSIDEIWSMSPQMCEMIKRSGVSTPCYSFPEAIDVGKSVEKINPFVLNVPKDFTFYTIAQWIDRKGFKQLLRAYWKAFEGNDKVSLLLKTYRINYSQSEFNLIKRDIEQWKKELKLQKYPKILLVGKLLSENQIDKIHALGDCFVNASAGEGWGRGMQEAMVFGKPVISGDNGGITDLMLKSQYFCVPSTSVNATEMSQIPWYVNSMHWKEIDEDKLASTMLQIYNRYEDALRVAKKAQEFCVENFSFQKIGFAMRDRLEEISKTL